MFENTFILARNVKTFGTFPGVKTFETFPGIISTFHFNNTDQKYI